MVKPRWCGTLSLLIPLANLCEEWVQAEEKKPKHFSYPEDFWGWDGEDGSLQPHRGLSLRVLW